MGEGDDIYSVSDKYVFFSRRDSKQGATSSYFRNQEYIGTGDVSGRIKVSGDHYVLYQVDNALIDGKDIGDISTSLQVNKIDQLLSNGNYAHYKDVDGETHIFYNQKDLGEGIDFDVSENNIVFTRRIDGNDHVIFNGKDLGEGRFPVISGDNIVYANTVKAANGDSGTIYHVFFNGKDLGECAPSQGPDFSKTLGNCQNIKFSK